MSRSSRVLVSFFCLSLAALLALLTGVAAAAGPADQVPITTKSKDAADLFIQARNLMELGHTEKAYDLFSQAVAKDPDFALGHLYKAMTASETKDFNAELAKAVELAPKASEGEQKLIAGVRAAIIENNRVKQREIFEKLVTDFPKDPRILWYLSSVYDALAEYDKEIAACDKAIAIDKEYFPPYQTLGYAQSQKERFDKAEAAFREYLRLCPKEANSHDNLADLYRRTGKFAEAIQHYSEAVKMDPTFLTSQYKIGTTLAFMDKFDEARQALQKSMDMEVKPAYRVYDQEAIARTYIYAGDYAKAMEAADKAVRMAGELGLPEEAPGIHETKAFSYLAANELDKAEASTGDLLKSLADPDLPPIVKQNNSAAATYLQACIAAGRKDFTTAMAKAQEYKAQIEAIKNPVFQKYPSSLYGHIALLQGEYTKAVDYFAKGYLDEPYFLYYFAVAKEKAGDVAGAKELYKKVANWNRDTLSFALFRKKAAAKI
jgi:tetratricopeptide (TPR) repeat protein